ncbi:MAG: hypothetical protein JNN20_09190 [Betaproteobacteria bacterium]|nr:hypothetical protein [Betaproteobacteria bacterium]
MAKHFLYLTNDKLTTLVWGGGSIVERNVFSASEADSIEFGEYIAQHAASPTYFVTDLIEEDFRTDTVPHLRGNDRDAVLGRKLAQLYRASNFRHAIVQDREEEGRRDDRVLYHAITNPDLLTPWLAVLEKAEVPLEGIYSSAVLSAGLPKELGLFFTHTLLVTIVPDFGLRQTYFQNKQIKFSRLTPIIYDEGQSVGSLIAAEISRTWQYLDSLRYFAGGDTLEVCMLVHARDHAMIAEAARSFPLLKYRFLDIEEVAAKIKLKPGPVSSHAEEVLVHLYAQSSIENHFAEKEQTRYAAFRKAKIALYGVTAGLLAIGAAGAGFNLYQAAAVSAEIDKREPQLRQLKTEYQAIAKEISGQAAATDTVRDSSSFFRAQMRPQPAAPGVFLKELASVWSKYPGMQLLQVVWMPHHDRDFTPPSQAAAPRAAQSIRSEAKAIQGAPATPSPLVAAPNEGDASLPGNKFEILIVEGSVERFKGDYRAALDSIDRLLGELNKTPNLKASAITLPVDTRSGALLRAVQLPQETDRLLFTLKIVRDRGGV